ncbi:MAG: hypothetical protein LBO80_11420 [Treponema sp.]|jgi:hypothetical protein|nr:hypothetical protein [Treponema sp.]
MKGKFRTPLFRLRDGGILFGWIIGILAAGGLIWFFTQPLRTRALMRAVNGVLLSAGDPRRLAAYLPSPAEPERPLGLWYTRSDSAGKAVVFTMMDHGIQASFAAMLSPKGDLEALIPLSSHAERIQERLVPEFVQLYLRRIVTGEQP